MFDFFKEKKPEGIENGPLLSVIMPVYNHELYVGEAIESVLSQYYKDIELIIIDDGSKDSSFEVVSKYTSDSRVTAIKQENAGAHNAINKGLNMAKGEYLAVINSDDVFEKNRFSIMVEYMEQHKNVGFACSYIRVIDSKGKNLGVKQGWRNMEPWLVEHPEKSLKANDDFTENLIMTNFTSTTSNFLFRRDVYENIGGMRNLRFAHDWEFALRAAEVTDCVLIEKPLMRYRVHNSNTISSNRKWMLFEVAWMWAANIERFCGNALFKNPGDYGDVIRLAESLNLQGNDKVLWMILLFIQSQRKLGVEKPEELLLDDEDLRKMFLDYVTE